jgi:hypothetical protein
MADPAGIERRLASIESRLDNVESRLGTSLPPAASTKSTSA